MFETIANVVIRRGPLVLGGWVILGVALALVAPRWESVSRDDDVSFFPAGYPSVVGQNLLVRAFPTEAAGSQVVMIVERASGMLTPDDFAYVSRLSDAIKPSESDREALGFKQILDHRSPVIGSRLVGVGKNGKSQAALIIIALNGTYLAKQTRLAVDAIQARIDGFEKPPAGLTLGLTGSAAVGHDMNTATVSSAANTTYATIALVIIILLVVYRSPLLALIPLVTIAISVWVSLKAIAALTRVPGINFQVINITNIFVIVVLFGAGTDYCLFLIARYREELARGRMFTDALRESIKQVGGALVASAGTVICGLSMLWFSSFAKIQYTGPAIALSLVIGLVASLTIAPIMLYWLRGAVFFPFKPPHHEKGRVREEESLEQIPMSGFWAKVSDLVVARPGTILALSLLVLLPFAVIGARTESNYSQFTDLGPREPSILGARMVQRYFAEGELGPTGVLIHHPTIDFRSDDGRAAVASVSRSLAALPNVAEVRSVSQPLGKPVEDNFAARIAERLARPLSDPKYVSTKAAASADVDRITKLDIVFRSEPFSDTSLSTLESVKKVVSEATAPGGALAGASAFGLTGSTALVSDLKSVTTHDERLMYILVTVGVYLILWILLKRPWISLYLIATVILGYLASLGMTELVFMALHEGVEPWAGQDWKVGFFLFVILVAVGEDYNIFLMTRVLEEEHKHGPVEGTRRAVAHTGGIISSCGVIMAGTFASMLTGKLTALRELGFALGLGVLLDTFIVRPILVPAFVILVHRVKESLRGRRESPVVLEQTEATASP